MPGGGEAVGRVWFWWFRVYYCDGTAGSERLGTFIVADINGFVLGICSGAVKEILLLWSLQLGQLARLWGSGGWANPEN
jgi:hypothetical protein